MRRISVVFCLFIFLSVSTFEPFVSSVFAQSAQVDQLKTEINSRNSRLAQIEKEIAAYQAALGKVGSEKKTLTGAIAQLELERKKISADLSYTENKIGFTDLEISKINIEVTNTESDIQKNKSGIGEILDRISERDQEPLMELLLRQQNLSQFWGEISTFEQVRSALNEQVTKLASLKQLLEGKRSEQKGHRDQLVNLKNQYSDQKQVLENTKSEKTQLLVQTKNKETSYQKILVEKRKASEQLTKELRDYESQLKFILDPNSVPKPGTAVFAWPLSKIIITQYFGGTEFAKRNAGVYAGRPYHPGVDFGATRGTKIYAPLAGTVRATGDTDLVAGCSSWGKWTLIDHRNGLTSLYAHQDTIVVSAGQSVQQGDVIGYTGNTGYSTGPHLHFTVYASRSADGSPAVSVRKFSEIKTTTNCGPATTPVAATGAYLDPMQYLPK